MYEFNIFVQGFPGKSPTHGGLGWSSITLLRKNNRNIIVDVGGFGVRKLLVQKLKEFDLVPSDISQVLLTHLHWDHCVNWTMFPNAEIIVSREDMDWALEQPWGQQDVPELYVKKLNESNRLRLVDHLEEVAPNIIAHQTRGHTPGHIAFEVDNNDFNLIFSGDAAKNRAELLSRDVDMSLNIDESKNSIKYLWNLWKSKKNNILIPGHDIIMKLNEHNMPKYLEDRDARLICWFDEDIVHFTSKKLNNEVY